MSVRVDACVLRRRRAHENEETERAKRMAAKCCHVTDCFLLPLRMSTQLAASRPVMPSGPAPGHGSQRTGAGCGRNCQQDDWLTVGVAPPYGRRSTTLMTTIINLLLIRHKTRELLNSKTSWRRRKK